MIRYECPKCKSVYIEIKHNTDKAQMIYLGSTAKCIVCNYTTNNIQEFIVSVPE